MVLMPMQIMAIDTDGDLIDNSIDLDDDNDGILDSVETPPTIPTLTSGHNTKNLAGTLASTCATGTFVLSNNFNTKQFTVDRGIQLDWNQRKNKGTTIQLTSTTVGSSLFNTLEFGISGPNPTKSKAIRKQDVTVSWSVGGAGILSDPLNQVTSHADGAIINSGDLLNIKASSFYGSRWRVTVPLGDVTGSIVVDFVSSNGPGTGNDHEGFWFDTALSCDTDGDTTPDYLDTDSDGDGCPDAVEGAANFTAADIDVNLFLTGGVDANGIPLVAGTGQADTVAKKTNAVISIATPVSEQNVLIGNDATFTVGATGSSKDFNTNITTDITAGLTYQWQVSTDIGVSFTDLGGETASSLTLPAVTLGMHNNVYKVIISHADRAGCTEESIAVLKVQDPQIALIKTASIGGTGVAGDTITYTFAVTNTGNVDLTNVIVTDPLTGLVLSGSPLVTLVAGTTNNTITGSYTIKQSDMNTGSITNSATVTATPPSGPAVTDTSDDDNATEDDPTVTTLIQTASYTVAKATADTPLNQGDTLTYTFDVNNTGNVNLTAITVTDVKCAATPTLSSGVLPLAPGAVAQYSCTSVAVTQAEVDAGKVDNTASVTVTPPVGVTPPTAVNATVSTPITQTASYTVAKATADTPTNAGETLTYTFDVNNTGNVSLTAITVTDAKCAATPTLSSGTLPLAPGAVAQYSCTSVAVTQAEVDVGKVDNTASVTVVPPVGVTPPTAVNATVSTPIVSMPAISITKKGTFGSNSSVQLGDTISYEFNITNIGNVTLFNVKVEDTNATVTGNPITLAPGKSNTTAYTAVHIVTQDDIDANKVVNQAVVLSEEANGNDINASSDDPNTVASNDSTVTQLPIESPMAAIDEANGTIGQPSTVDILANDNGGTFAIDPSSVKIVAPDGSLVTELVVAGEGVWKVNPDGTITFTPNADFSGDPTPIKYRVDDIQGNPVTTDGEIKIDYPPVAIDDIVSSLLVEPVIVKILDNDKNTSTPLDPESVSLVPPANATNVVSDADGDIIGFTVAEGVWSVDELTGDVTFTPANSFTGGNIPAIAYTVQETDGKLVSNEASITVNYVADTIKAREDGTIVIDHYGSNVIDVLKNDEFKGDVTIKITEQPSHGTVEVAIDSDGRPVIIYTPDPDINHVPDSFKYSITDVNGQVSEAIVKIDVECGTSQKSDGGDTYGRLNILIMMFMTIMIGLYLRRREEKSRGEV